MAAFIMPGAASALTARDKYHKAEASYKKLRHSPKKMKYRENWLACINKFNAVYRHNPSGPWAPAGLYMTGHLYTRLYKYSFKKSDKQEALDIFQRIIKRFPKSRYSSKARSAKLALTGKKVKKRSSIKKTSGKKTRSKKTSTKKTATKKKPAPNRVPGKTFNRSDTTITGLRFWSNQSYTRIVIDADKETSYVHRLLKKDPAIKKPQRLYLDFKKSKLKKNVAQVISVNDHLLRNIRVAQYKPEDVRVVIDIKSFKNYKIFNLKNPFRIVVDVWGKEINNNTYATKKSYIGNKKHIPIITGALAKQLALGVKKIVIDPGHGGRDYGAPGYLKGVHEKKIVLQIAKKLAKKIRSRLKCEVVMTRQNDKFLTLEERTAIANTKNADLFISIHTNAARNRRAYGIETYFLNLATDDDAILVAARENATSAKNISDLETILSDLMQNAKINESSRLATYVQKALYKGMKKKYSKIKSKGVKQAPFYVLLGARMPAILVETSFISNPRECRRLSNAKYQENLCNAIVDGIKKYILETNPTAFLREDPHKTTGKKYSKT
ncbi:MAG: N-acetylmuramoyl-L-alanine amidase [Desulfosarcina sp.]|nr:N-acetylmuramoyl-L-alanine amidase [Desulfobacterales bacterium]